MAAAVNNSTRYIYKGRRDEYIPGHVTHIIVREDVTVVRSGAFFGHFNVIEVICHDKVERIEEDAFNHCRSLKRVIMPGVTIVKMLAFYQCFDLVDVQCDSLERIGYEAFGSCKSLSNIHLPSIKVVGEGVFEWCVALTDVTFGSKLMRIEGRAFNYCSDLERITIPLKDGLITDDDIFMGCQLLENIDLIEGELHEIIAALHLEQWRNDIYREIDLINEILPDKDSGDDGYIYSGGDFGEKAAAIREWIWSVFGAIVEYEEEHERLLNEAATALQLTSLPRDTVLNNVIPFLALPPLPFFEVVEVEDEFDEEYFEGEESEDDDYDY